MSVLLMKVGRDAREKGAVESCWHGKQRGLASRDSRLEVGCSVADLDDCISLPLLLSGF